MKGKGNSKRDFNISDYSKMMEPGGKTMTDYAKLQFQIRDRIDAIVNAPSEEEVISARELLEQINEEPNTEGDKDDDD